MGKETDLAGKSGVPMFSNQDLKRLIVPLFLEQLLVALVGIADVFVVGFVGEAAVSGVSLVNAFNTIFINLFTALAAGGAVVISQYIGRRENERAGEAATQLLTASALFSVAISVVILSANSALMRLMFGQVEEEVMQACVTYLRISAYSYPALAVYNAGAALYRSFGKTSTTMYVSIAANIINVVGNCIGVFALHAGVAGVATPIFVSFSALAGETRRLTILLVLVHNIFNTVAFPFADPLGKGLRATGDVKFTTAVSLITTLGVRLILSVLFGVFMNLGVMGLAYAMCLDWTIRGAIFWRRFRRGKWRQLKVI